MHQRQAQIYGREAAFGPKNQYAPARSTAGAADTDAGAEGAASGAETGSGAGGAAGTGAAGAAAAGSWNQLWRQLAQRTVRPLGPIAVSGTT